MHSRTWATEPGVEARSGLSSVWTESTITRSGSTSSMAPTTCGQRDLGGQPQQRVQGPEALGPEPDLLGRLLAREVQDLAARRPPPRPRPGAARWTCRCPGSPPSSVTDPGTRPPPSTRSSSATPVGRGLNSVGSTSLIWMGGDEGGRIEIAAAAPTGPSSSSMSVPHASHPLHRPVHLGSVAPHSEQRYSVLVRAMGETLVRGSDSRTHVRRTGRRPSRPRRRIGKNRPMRPETALAWLARVARVLSWPFARFDVDGGDAMNRAGRHRDHHRRPPQPVRRGGRADHLPPLPAVPAAADREEVRRQQVDPAVRPGDRCHPRGPGRRAGRGVRAPRSTALHSGITILLLPEGRIQLRPRPAARHRAGRPPACPASPRPRAMPVVAAGMIGTEQVWPGSRAPALPEPVPAPARRHLPHQPDRRWRSPAPTTTSAPSRPWPTCAG